MAASQILLPSRATQPATCAGPAIAAGDLALRHDIQRLADAGVIKGTVTTWPLAWAPILADMGCADITQLAPDVADAIVRVILRANYATRSDEIRFRAKLGLAEKPTRIRSFQNTPRGKAEVSVGFDWLGDGLSLDLNVQAVDSDQDDADVRADNSMIGMFPILASSPCVSILGPSGRSKSACYERRSGAAGRRMVGLFI